MSLTLIINETWHVSYLYSRNINKELEPEQDSATPTGRNINDFVG